MSFVQVVEMELTNKKNGHENLVLMPRVTFEVTSYQATCQPNLNPLKICLSTSYNNET
jgi:hypothetical protein